MSFLKILLSWFAIISAIGLNKTLVFFSSHFSKPINSKYFLLSQYHKCLAKSPVVNSEVDVLLPLLNFHLIK